MFSLEWLKTGYIQIHRLLKDFSDTSGNKRLLVHICLITITFIDNVYRHREPQTMIPCYNAFASVQFSSSKVNMRIYHQTGIVYLCATRSILCLELSQKSLPFLVKREGPRKYPVTIEVVIRKQAYSQRTDLRQREDQTFNYRINDYRVNRMNQ